MKSLILALLVFLSLPAWSATPTQTLARAIAKAEGFGVKGSKPTRLHNPGDFRSSSRHAYPGQVGIDRSGYVIFKSDRYGWAALESAINKIIAGDSVNYNVNMTLKQLSRKYATSPTWIRNVAKNLGCDQNTWLWEILDVPPVLNFNIPVRLPNMHGKGTRP